METKISIVVPAYNIEPYIGRCLDSLLAQTYRNLEIIAVDDGSRDGTGRLLDAYAAKDSRIRVLHQENSGVTAARLAALRQVTGEYVGFVDGDDEAEPDMFELLLGQAQMHQADISHCGYQMVFPDGKTYLYYGTGRFVVQDRETGVYDLLRGEFVEPGLWNKLYRAELFDRLFDNPLLDTDIRINEDLLLNYILFSAAEKSVFIDQCKYHYLLRKGSAATAELKPYKLTDPQRVMKKLYEDTQGDICLHRAAAERYVRCLVANSTQTRYPEVSETAQKTLKNLREKGALDLVSHRLRCMAEMVCTALPLYRLVRKIYERITGVAHKYDVE